MAFDADVLRYLEARGQRLNRSVAYQVRAILRAWMDAEIASAAAPGRTPLVHPLDASGPPMGDE